MGLHLMHIFFLYGATLNVHFFAIVYSVWYRKSMTIINYIIHVVV